MNPTDRNEALRRRTGAVLALSSALAFSVMGYLAKYLSREMPSTEIAFFRASIGVLILLPWTVHQMHRLLVPEAKLLVLRGVAGAGSALCYFWTMAKTSVANARAIADIAPLFVVVLGWQFLGERPTRIQFIYIMIGALGTSLLGLPGATSCPADAWLVGVVGALCGALAYFSLRKVSVYFPTPLTVTAFMGTLAVASIVLWNQDWKWPNARETLGLGVVGVTGLVGQVLMTAAYARLPAFLATALVLSTLPFVAGIEFLLDQTIPSLVEFVSYGLILLSVFLHAKSTMTGLSAD